MDAKKIAGSMFFLIAVYLFVNSYSDGSGGAGGILQTFGDAVTNTTLTLQGRGGSGSSGNRLGTA